ncbi:MAG: MBL fold metallo-hydrolase [Candidatus Moranbacteria bacterium]|nr:MBL fold metallo-hydrolase [Candidatus Moranbacteria bacterium]
MNIQYYGDFCFKLTTKPAGRATEEVVVWTDLPEKSTGIRSPFGHADVVLLSYLNPTDDVLSGLKDEPEILYTPGEYSVKGVTILGYPSFRDGVGGVEKGQNTVFVFDSEEMRFVYLGGIGHPPDDGLIEKIGDVDVLFIPIGGEGIISQKKADEIIRDIEPKIVIPMHYQMEGTTIQAETPESFCRETGRNFNDELGKLNFKKKDLDGKSMEVTFLKRT